MLEKLKDTMRHLPKLLDSSENWDSMIVNRRKPHTYRIFSYFTPDAPFIQPYRICLHRFEPCHDHEAFIHPHPWPGAFLVLKGRYGMNVGLAPNKTDPPEYVTKLELTAGSMYEITNALTFHSVIPFETTYTVMINGEPWPESFAHKEVRRTKGKDLDKISSDELTKHLLIYKSLAHDWLVEQGY